MRSIASITLAASSASSRQPTARRRFVKLSRASVTPDSSLRPFSILRIQPAQPTPSTASSMWEMPSASRLTNKERSRVSAMVRSLTKNDALFGAEQPFAVARKLDDEVPLPGRGRQDAAEPARCVRLHGYRTVPPAVVGVDQQYGCLKAGQWQSATVLRRKLDLREVAGLGTER